MIPWIGLHSLPLRLQYFWSAPRMATLNEKTIYSQHKQKIPVITVLDHGLYPVSSWFNSGSACNRRKYYCSQSCWQDYSLWGTRMRCTLYQSTTNILPYCYTGNPLLPFPLQRSNTKNYDTFDFQSL